MTANISRFRGCLNRRIGRHSKEKKNERKKNDHSIPGQIESGTTDVSADRGTRWAQIIINDCYGATAVVRFVKYRKRRSFIKLLWSNLRSALAMIRANHNITSIYFQHTILLYFSRHFLLLHILLRVDKLVTSIKRCVITRLKKCKF